MGASFEVDGYEALMKNIKALGAKGRRVENRAVRKGAEPLAETIREEVPVSNIESADYIHIKDNIETSGIKRIDGIPFVEVGPGKETAWRAKFLEIGTVKMLPDPFISRSIKLSKQKVKAAMVTEVKRGLGL